MAGRGHGGGRICSTVPPDRVPPPPAASENWEGVDGARKGQHLARGWSWLLWIQSPGPMEWVFGQTAPCQLFWGPGQYRDQGQRGSNLGLCLSRKLTPDAQH